jgi:hypothetical protein
MFFGQILPPYINMFSTSTCGDGWSAGPAIFNVILPLFCIFVRCDLVWKFCGYAIKIVLMHIKGPNNVLERNM